MATSHAQKTSEDDPFNVTPTSTNRERARSLRHSQLDPALLTSFTRGSPSQAKRALEAHLTDTDRRIQDASKLGTTLLEQKKQLAARLKDLESQKDDEEIGADLQQKLSELEKEYNEVGRETARAFIPKSSRGNINFNANDSERTPLAEKGASVNTDTKARIDSTEVNGKTTSRRARNQGHSNKHDLEFATEISTSLLGQVRGLQNTLVEKEDALKKLQRENTQMHADAEIFSQRMRGLDDQEQKYKDENWTLETQVQDLTVQIKELAMREQKLQTALNTANQQKSTSEREYEELKSQHSRLTEDHSTLQRSHDVHIADFKRDLDDGRTERDEMQRRIDELYSQNQDLAKAVAYRVKAEQGEGEDGIAEDDIVESVETETPEASPPASPTKATPRHGALESETLKSSLHHAHRMIQNLKNNMHREKTEKIELKRMLQDARDEIEQQRNGGTAAANAGRKRQPARAPDGFKKPGQPAKLGGARAMSEWEDYEGSPSQHLSAARDGDLTTDASDAFETADERGAGMQTETETDAAFESAADTMAGSTEDELTETEGDFNRSLSTSKSRASMGNRRNSLESTASDEGDAFDLTTPPRQPKYQLRLNRSSIQRDGTPSMRDSPASFVSNSSQPRSSFNLASELEGMDDASSRATSRATTLDRSPAPSLGAQTPATPKTPIMSRSDTVRSSVPPSPRKPAYVDSATSTDVWEPEPRVVEKVVEKVVEVPAEPRVVEKIVDRVVEVPSEPRVVEKLVEIPAEPKIVEKIVEKVVEVPVPAAATRDAATQPTPKKSEEHKAPSIAAQAAALRQDDSVVAPLQLSNISSQSTAPISIPKALTDRTVDIDTPTTPKRRTTDVLQDQFPVPGQENDDQSITPPAPSTSEDNKLAPSTQQFLNDILAQAHLKRAENDAQRSSTAGDFADTEASLAQRMAEQPASPVPSISITGGQAREPITPTRADTNEAHGQRQNVAAAQRNLQSPTTPSIRDSFAEDEVPSTYATPTALGSGTPWTMAQPVKKAMVNSSTQTAITNEQIENLLKDQKRLSAQNSVANSPALPRTPASSRAMSMSSSTDPSMLRSTRRPGSSSGAPSLKSLAADESRVGVPPLPPGHKELIAQAKDRSSSLMNMPPPNMTPGKFPRDRSSSQLGASPMRGSAIIQNTVRSRTSSMAGTLISRRSSVSSFASEIDERFDVPEFHGSNLDLPAGQGVIADPRMIQAITQTMIGEFLWKYTRKAGRGDGHSQSRHRRFFWIHPYTRTLYWSNQDPSVSGKDELKAKSVAITAVRVVGDDNPIPPGLSNKSIVVVTPGRSIKFTATTARRHEVWFNALSYLLLRSAPERDDDMTQNANVYTNIASYSQTNLAHDRSNTASSNITADDLADFTPGTNTRTGSRLSYRSNNSAATIRRSTIANQQRTSSPQGRSQPNSLANRQSQAAKRVTNNTPQPSPLKTNPPTTANDATRRASALASSDAPATTNPHTPSVDQDGFKKPIKPAARPDSTTSKEATSDPPAKQGKLSSFTSRISRASFASLARGRKRADPDPSTPSGASSNDNTVTQNTPHRSDERDMPADPATLASLNGTEHGARTEKGTEKEKDKGHEHVYTTHKKEDGTLENVRACCGGRHDLAELRNRSESRASLRSTRSRRSLARLSGSVA
ncbi:MAG: hypothetical protein Q9159_005492 [Coniocarpon cinnabarinum]